jgi:hypothetical protein
MLPQYQLHGGIRRLQTRFDQSKRFGTTTTMAASAAPTTWNRSSIGDFRWWDEIFLKPSSPIASGDATTVHGTMSLYELPHDLLVSALEGLVYRLDEPRFKKSPGDETLKTSFVSGPQTTYFHQDRCSQRNRPKNSRIKPIPPFCQIEVVLTSKVVSPDAVIPMIVEEFLPTITPTSPESAASDEITKGTIASSLSLPRKETFVCQSEVDRTFPGRTIPAIFTGVIRGFFAPAR